MKRSISWLVGGLLCAQNATAWKWHGYSTQGDATPVVSFATGKKGWVRVIGDTVYIMGTYAGDWGGTLSLPTTATVPSSSADLGASPYTNTYLAAYDRRTGRYAWWMWFYLSTASAWGTDLSVLPDGTVLTLLITAPWGCSYGYRDSTGFSSSGSIDATVYNGDRASFLVKITPTLGAAPVVSSASVGTYSLSGNGSVDLKHIFVQGNAIYTSGSYRQGTNPQGFGVNGVMNLLSLLVTGAPNAEQALLVAFDLNLTYLNAARLGNVTPPFGAARGHQVVPFPGGPNRLAWLVEVENHGPGPLLVQYRSTSGSLAGLGTLDTSLRAIEVSSPSLAFQGWHYLAKVTRLGESPCIR
ncbi:MAG: hypothetical protein N2170_09990, partial [Bacteroidia bacterium]|nr:hypothetical protein [Bacteroidia bacterium]